MMNIKLNRFCQTQDCTLGNLTVGKMELYSLEDLPSFTGEKVPGKTRVPAGHYEVKFRTVESPLTLDYRDKYSWFEWHLELQDIPNFTNVYIHVGNYAKNTYGCILVGEGVIPEKAMITNSAIGYERFYRTVSAALHDGQRVFIDIIDED